VGKFGSLVKFDRSRFAPKASIEEYRKRMGEGEGERGFVAVIPGTEKQVAKTEAIKAAWPRCGDAHKYLYKFKNGREICTQGWRNEFYVHVMLGTIPPAHLFDPVKRKESGIKADPVLQDSGPPRVGGGGISAVWSHPLFIPVAAVGVGGLALLLVLRNR